MEGGLLSLKWNNHRSSFIHVLSALRKKDSYCDVTLACDGKFYPSHKFVLSTCSEYFREMFQHTDCKHPIIVLKDIRCEDIESLLNYMYVGEVNVLQEKLSTLLKAAECLKIKGLAVPDDPAAGEKRSLGHDSAPESKRRKTDSDYHKYKDSSRPAKASKSSETHYRQSGTDPDTNFRSPNSQSDIDEKRSFDFTKDQNMSDKFPINVNISDKPKETDDSICIKQEPVDNIIDLEDSKEGILESSNPTYFNLLPQDENSDTERMGCSETQDIWDSESRSVDGYPPLEGSNCESRGEAEGSQVEAELWTLTGSSVSGLDWGSSLENLPSSVVDSSLPKETPIYQCTICSYSGKDKTNFKKHLRIHTGEKPYSCKYCPYRSSQSTNLKSHVRHRHPNQ